MKVDVKLHIIFTSAQDKGECPASRLGSFPHMEKRDPDKHWREG